MATEPLAKVLAANLKAIRVERGLGQDAMAASIGVHRTW